MPTTTSTRSPTPPPLSPRQNPWRVDQLLALAGSHELAELTRYRRLAFSFLTFNTAISRLLAGLGIECETRLKKLAHIAQRLELLYPLSSSERYYAKLHAKLRQKEAAPCHFIGSEDMAIDALTQALMDAEASRCFYEQLREASPASLHFLLAAIVQQKQAELGVLSERLTSGEGLTQPAALC
ncbi:hypothetical protein MKP05_13885 [Halomonas sp. EGI 63088]|uniref:Uncharacterized protein n=2 Tax=Pseudomonadati TaxID=3379134 RepID=A0ABS9RWH5_9GAMM|nr:hypothetical protein [Halomonas flagellata]MCH4564202.1 hypothetical protein [Halomonas flagellata]